MSVPGVDESSLCSMDVSATRLKTEGQYQSKDLVSYVHFFIKISNIHVLERSKFCLVISQREAGFMSSREEQGLAQILRAKMCCNIVVNIFEDNVIFMKKLEAILALAV